MAIIEQIRKTLSVHVTHSSQAARFFKTSPGSYSEHDQFLGIKVPDLRKIARTYNAASPEVLKLLLVSRYNEERLLALLILVNQYETAKKCHKETLYRFYLQQLECVNNWNLVDASAHKIIGAHLFDKDRVFLHELAHSENLWCRRIAVVSTLFFIRKADVDTTYTLAEQLMHDTHDLIHKAVGWMLREAGKKDENRLIAFLQQHARTMPRTMLRYAIEKLPAIQKKEFMAHKKASLV